MAKIEGFPGVLDKARVKAGVLFCELAQIIATRRRENIYGFTVYIAEERTVWNIRGKVDRISGANAVHLVFDDLVAVAFHHEHDLFHGMRVQWENGAGLHGEKANGHLLTGY